MKCFRCFSFALFALLGVFFGSFIINQKNNVSALSDLSVTLTSSNKPSGRYINFLNCPLTNGVVDCSGYHYLRIQIPEPLALDSSCPSTGYKTVSLLVRTTSYSGNTHSTLSSLYFPDFLIRLPDNVTQIFAGDVISNSPFYDTGCIPSITFTLSETNPFIPSSSPSGSITLTENGTFDVSSYAEAVVNVPETDCPPGGGGNYHEDLVAINNSIMICAATCLVIYFFYCIYRMIIKNSGVK